MKTSVVHDSVSAKEAVEIDFWRTSAVEGPESDSLENIFMKAAEARVFMEKTRKFSHLFQAANSVLELGGGQCWASCIVKRLNPQATVIGTDISPSAIASVGKWEHVFRTKIDGTEACRSYATPFPDASFDLAFAYSAAHHFVRHRSTLRELFRIIKPGGTVLYLHEPGCQPYMHRLAKWRVNAIRPEVPEDVLVFRKLEHLGCEAGFEVLTNFAPTLTNRGPNQTIYYYALQKVRFLQYILPTSIDMVFKKSIAA